MRDLSLLRSLRGCVRHPDQRAWSADGESADTAATHLWELVEREPCKPSRSASVRRRGTGPRQYGARPAAPAPPPPRGWWRRVSSFISAQQAPQKGEPGSCRTALCTTACSHSNTMHTAVRARKRARAAARLLCWSVKHSLSQPVAPVPSARRGPSQQSLASHPAARSCAANGWSSNGTPNL